MNVDWSKAPEGFPLWLEYLPKALEDDFERQAAGGCWVKEESDRYWTAHGTYWSKPPEGFYKIHRRPDTPQRNGEGLPPVGASVEWFSPVYGWLGGRVVGHDGAVAVISHNDGYTGCHLHEVRPIRTPEQIAAEAREAELNRMVATVQMLDKGWARKVCAGLYDHGYRKQEQPE